MKIPAVLSGNTKHTFYTHLKTESKGEIIKKGLPRNSPLLSWSVKFELLAASGAKENENWCPL